ncbi:MAG: adenylosuccinate lyase [Actinomycetaceae bacterium]|nr:adenylosuccinate lyase [Actinomycetaceae bacterium]
MTDLGALEDFIALGPLDGRYRSVAEPLVNHLSEAALNRARLHIEIEWLTWLTTHGVLPGAPTFSEGEKQYLRSQVSGFGAAEIAQLATIEAETRHDVKAVEYLLKSILERAPQELGANTVLPKVKEIVHIFCTSEDINNLSYGLVIRSAVQRVWLPKARALVEQLKHMAKDYRDVPMLAHTHGQPATPVTMGHEIAVWAYRLGRQIDLIDAQPYLGKINGATGDFAAHTVAVPNADWPAISRGFVEHLGLTWNPLTTQIESHDWQSELYANVARFNRIAHNVATDTWSYISMGYFHQKLSAQGSTGSSTMPHKVNPIRFENAEANMEISCALLDSLAATLVTSRLQRDLTDSTTQRNAGVGLGHSLLAIDNLMRGFDGLEADTALLARDLDNNWEVLGEAVQQAMRVAAIAGATGMEDPYERLKDLTRGHKVDGPAMRAFIESLGLPKDVEQRLTQLTPATYTGIASDLVNYLE